MQTYSWNYLVLGEDEEEERVLITPWKTALPILSDLELLIPQTQANGLGSIQFLLQSFLFLLLNPREEAGNDNPQVREMCLSRTKPMSFSLLKYLCGRARRLEVVVEGIFTTSNKTVPFFCSDKVNL